MSICKNLFEGFTEDTESVVSSLVDHAPSEEQSDERRESVSEEPDNKDIWIGVTLNLPRTTSFLNMTTEEQKRKYHKILKLMLEKHPVYGCTIEIDSTFEFCKTGMVHMHCALTYHTLEPMYITGVIVNLVKVYKRLVKQVYREASYSEKYMRYRDASICVQYYDEYKDCDVTRGWEQWTGYIHKMDGIVKV